MKKNATIPLLIKLACVYLRHLRFFRLGFSQQDSLLNTYHHAQHHGVRFAVWQQIYEQ
jgi:hypothetical protein